jgi:hypothetical protein
MRNLYDKAPEAVRILATTILEYSDINNGRQNGIEGPQQKSARLDNSAIQSTKYKNASSKDLSYRPSKSAKAKVTKSKAEKTNFLDNNFGHLEKRISFHTNDSAQDNVSNNILLFIQGEGIIT